LSNDTSLPDGLPTKASDNEFLVDETRVNAEWLSVVVPCYNEELVIEESVNRISSACALIFGDNYEIILVDDGSSDRTWPLIEDCVTANDRIRGVQLSRNHGHQLALLAGLSEVSGSLVLIIDADLQDPPELLTKMLNIMNEQDADVVYGQRLSREGESTLKKVSASLFYRFLARATDTSIRVDTGDFRLMRRPVASLLLQMPERDRFTRGMVAWLGFRQVPCLYHRDERLAGDTKYTPRKMIGLAVNAFLGFSMAPLRIAIFLSAITAIVSGGMVLYVLWALYVGMTVVGWASTMAVTTLLASAQFAVLAVIGEYIGRIYLQDKRRPLFLVRKSVGMSRRAEISAKESQQTGNLGSIKKATV